MWNRNEIRWRVRKGERKREKKTSAGRDRAEIENTGKYFDCIIIACGSGRCVVSLWLRICHLSTHLFVSTSKGKNMHLNKRPKRKKRHQVKKMIKSKFEIIYAFNISNSTHRAFFFTFASDPFMSRCLPMFKPNSRWFLQNCRFIVNEWPTWSVFN